MANPLGVGMVELVEDGQRPHPGVAGGVSVSVDRLGLGEMSECVGLVEAVTEVPIQLEGSFVASDGASALAEMMVGVAEAVPRVGFAGAMAELLVQLQRPLAIGDGPLIVAEFGVAPPEVVERTGLSGPVTGSREQLECLVGVLDRVGVQILLLEQPAEVVVGVGLSGAVAERAVQPEGLREMGVRTVVPTQSDVREGDAAVGPCLFRPIAESLRGVQGSVLGGDPVVPVSPVIEERGERSGQLPGVRVESGAARQFDSGQQDRMLGGEPGQLVVDKGFWCHTRCGRREGNGFAVGTK